MSNVNVAVNSDVISDATSIGTRDTSANIAPSGSSADRTTLKPRQWARKQLPRPTDSGPLSTRTPPRAARARTSSKPVPPLKGDP